MNGTRGRKRRTEGNGGSPNPEMEEKEEEKVTTIYIRRMVEKIIPMDVKLSATVKQLKREIYKQGQIQVEDQILDFAGVPLRDDQPLSAYGIKYNSHLHVMEKTRNRGWISLFVKTPTEVFPISLCGQSRLKNLKQKLFEKLGVEVKQQRIIFEGKLQTDRLERLETFGHGSTIELHLPRLTKVTVCTASNRKEYPLWIENFNTGFEVKMKIFELLRIIPATQRIYINDTVVEDDILMREYEISDKTVLQVHENTDSGKIITVAVILPSGEEVELKSDRLKSVYSLKQRIQGNKAIPVEKQRLFLKDKELRDWQSLGEGELHNGDKIGLFLRSKVQIFIKYMKTHTIEFDVRDDVSVLQEIVEDITGLSVEAQRLHLGSKQLYAGHTAAHFGVGRETTLQLVMRLCGC